MVEEGQSGDRDERYLRRREGILEFLGTFDEMRVRPPWRQGDRPIPTLQVTGPIAATIAVTQALDTGCDGTPLAHLRRRVDPVGPPTQDRENSVSPLSAQLREAADQLARVAPRWEAHLRFPLLAQVLWL